MLNSYPTVANQVANIYLWELEILVRDYIDQILIHLLSDVTNLLRSGICDLDFFCHKVDVHLLPKPESK